MRHQPHETCSGEAYEPCNRFSFSFASRTIDKMLTLCKTIHPFWSRPHSMTRNRRVNSSRVSTYSEAIMTMMSNFAGMTMSRRSAKKVGTVGNRVHSAHRSRLTLVKRDVVAIFEPHGLGYTLTHCQRQHLGTSSVTSLPHLKHLGFNDATERDFVLYPPLADAAAALGELRVEAGIQLRVCARQGARSLLGEVRKADLVPTPLVHPPLLLN